MNIDQRFFDKSYFENGPQTGKSLYQNYRWIPELTIPLAHNILNYTQLDKGQSIMDFGCAKGYLVYALRLLGVEAYGIDISSYAVDNSPHEITQFLKCVEPYSNNFISSDLILCKDVLEHIPYEGIDQQLDILRSKCKSIFALIPLAENGKYLISAYELDQSHYIRESMEWWQNRFIKAGFERCNYTTDLGPFKMSWQQANSLGNLLVYGN